MSYRTVRALGVRVLVVLCLLGLPGAAASAAEQITRFAADIAVQPSGDLLVTETIAVRAEGDRIRRGIFRTVPLAGPDGRRMGFSLVAADRDGGPVPTELTWDEAGVRVRLGDPGRDLPPGDHVFTLTYRAAGTVLAGTDADSLTWNVTGSGWEFPIAAASLRLSLPQAVAPLSWQVATGAEGSGESNAEAAVGTDGVLAARALIGLPPGHGMTVRIDLPKGLVETAGAVVTEEPPPVPADPLAGLPTALGALGVVLIFYGAAWLWVGRDPAAGRITQRPLPPAAMSPAAVRYVRRMAYDSRCLAAALVNMAVNGWLTIDRRPDGGWLLKRTGASEDILFPEERAVAGKLFFAMAFERGLDDADGRWLRQASEALKEALEKGNADRLFVMNRGFVAAGVALSLLAVVAMFAGAMDIGSAVMLAFTVGSVILVIAVFALKAWRRLRRMARGRSIGDTLMWLFGSLPILAIGGLFAFFLLADVPPVVLAGMAALVGINVFFAWALKAPTRDGRRVQDEIEGLAAFLAAAGGAAGAAAAVADDTLPPDRYLPYALALDQEKAWAAGFGATVATAAAGATDAGPEPWPWYTGTGDLDTLTGDLGGGLSSHIDRASVPPPEDDDDGGSSSSSSSGGGFRVGGGFGGGGGGGF